MEQSAGSEKCDDKLTRDTKVVSSVQPKYRHEWYQSQSAVVVTVFAKGMNRDYVKVEFGEQMLSVGISVPNEESYVLQTRLFGKIDTGRCRYEVLSTKIEIRLEKAEPVQWKGLEYGTQQSVISVQKDPAMAAASRKKTSKKNWDALEAEVKKEEKDEHLEGDAALNKLFREIYQNADEDTRRAMNKSFVESNGTVLSTNWKEVGSKQIAGSAPDGMEMKKWET